MANSPFSPLFAAYFFFHLVLIPYTASPLNAVGLSYDLYNKSCPNVERIIKNVVSQKLLQAQVTAAGALRIFFHDCFVEVGDPRWEVQKGRRDGVVSKASRVAGNIPQVNHTISQLISLLNSKGLSVLDMVPLSGGHTIGFSHCNEFMPRIYGYNKIFDIDPAMNQDYAHSLRGTCPRKNLDPTGVALNDISTPFSFDNAYYRNLQKGRGLLETDQMLVFDPMTRDYVNILAKDQQNFFSYLVTAMIKLGSIGVKTGSDGEIRHDCGSFNS